MIVVVSPKATPLELMQASGQWNWCFWVPIPLKKELIFQALLRNLRDAPRKVSGLRASKQS
ncbi:MAG: hypothetical protein ABSH38_20205 [Verrucomicrobiota bacterium]|jgi:hypothetical protein